MWYVIQTDAGKERSVCRKCEQAFPGGSYKEIFVPGYMRLAKREGTWTEGLKVLFPGYFFVDASDPASIEDVLRHYLSRIAKPVCVGDEFIPIYEDEQRFLEEMMDGDHIVRISKGDIVNGECVLYEGPMKGRTDRIVYIDRHKRSADVKVYLHGMERKIHVGLVIVSKTAGKAG